MFDFLMKKKPTVDYLAFNMDLKKLILSERHHTMHIVLEYTEASVYQIRFNLQSEHVDSLIQKHMPQQASLGTVRIIMHLKYLPMANRVYGNATERYAVHDLYFIVKTKAYPEYPAGYHWETGKYLDMPNHEEYFKQYLDNGPTFYENMSSPKLYNQLANLLNGGDGYPQKIPKGK